MSQNVRVDRRVAGDRRVQDRYAAFERRNGLTDRRIAAWERPAFEPVVRATTTDPVSSSTERAATTTPKAPPLRAVLVACDLGCLAVAWLAIGFVAHRWYGQRWSLVVEAAVFMVFATG